MSKKSTGGSSNMLLLAGLGVGAFMLFSNKSNAQSKAPAVDLPTSESEASEIPSAPKILAVNTSSTESPTPTGIVSDEEGMEPAGTSAATSSSGGDSSGEDAGSESGSSSGGGSSNPIMDMVVSAGTSVMNSRTSQGDDIPPLISTTLTQKEKTIIDKGVLSDALAIQRPDLYKAIYLRKHGKTEKALQAADSAIQNIQMKGNSTATAHQKRKRKVAIKLNPNSGNMVQAAAQTGGGIAAMAALSAINSMQYATGNGKAPAKKAPLHHKGAHPHGKPVHHTTTAHHPAKKIPVKHPASTHHVPVHHKGVVHKKY